MRRILDEGHSDLMDAVAIEKPLALDLVYGQDIRRTSARLATTMRTPGHDVELALGLIFSLGIIDNVDDCLASSCPRNVLDKNNEIDSITLTLHPRVNYSPLDHGFAHARYSSCGICGMENFTSENKIPLPNFYVDRKIILSLPSIMRTNQHVFQDTGGTHGAALFSRRGELIALFEDIGRHNALDKLVGHLLLHDLLPARDRILLMSSRGSIEIIEKAARAGIAVVVVLGAVSTLAISLAQKSGVTLIGFLQRECFNVYSYPERIT